MTTIDVQVIDQGPLTDREADIAKLMAEGYADKVIAQKLAISIKTVNSHTANLYLKLQVHADSANANTAAINARCRAVSLMFARKILSVSVAAAVKLVAVALIYNMAQFDDELLRSRSARARARVAASRIERNA